MKKLRTLDAKQKEILSKATELQTKFAETLLESSAKEFKDKIVKQGYALMGNSDHLLEIIEDLRKKVRATHEIGELAVTSMINKGRELSALQKRLGRY